MNFGERIKAIRKSEGLTQAEFGTRIGVGGSTISLIEKGTSGTTRALKESIIRVYSVNPLYLTGESDIMHLPPDEDEELIDRVMASQDPLIKALLLGIVKRPDGWRLLAESVLATAQSLQEAGVSLDKPDD